MKNRTLFAIAASTLLSLNSFGSIANMTLIQDQSSINFVSTKNQHVSEQHTFDRFSGVLDHHGKLTITIDITSVNTIIPIRNERILSMLFDASEYTTATFTADVSPELTQLKAGQFQRVTIAGEMMIAGNKAPVVFDVILTGLQNGGINATTAKPTIISTSAFNLDEGVTALQQIAMLQSISKSVPLSFSATFQK
jgi:polyisoprenoid-binding protein YceI